MAGLPDQDPRITPPPSGREDRCQANLSFAERFMAEHPGTFKGLADLREQEADLYKRLAE